MAEIRRKLVKQGKPSAVPRIVPSKDDKDKIAAWRQDLAKVLQVFDVRSIGPIGHSQLIASFQTELGIDTRMMVEDIDRNVLTGQDGAPGTDNSVRAICHPSTTECLPSPRLKPG